MQKPRFRLIILAWCLLPFPGLTSDLPASVDAPAILVHPEDAAPILGFETRFSVEASGSELEYQWMKDGMDIEGANAGELVIPVTTHDHQGEYTVSVSNAGGTATSLGASLSLPELPRMLEPLELPESDFAISGYESALGKDLLAVVESNGAAYVYRLDGDKWLQEYGPIPEAAGLGGTTLQFNGDVLAVGRPYDSGSVSINARGRIYFHERNRGGTGQWGVTSTEMPIEPSERFGIRMAMTSRLIAAARELPDPVLFIYEPADGSSWKKVARLALDALPRAIAASGDRVAVLEADRVVFFRRTGDTPWRSWERDGSMTFPLTPSSLSLSGDEIAVGHSSATEGGMVQLWTFESALGEWVPGGDVRAPVAASAFGSSVTLEGDSLAVGDPLAQGGGTAYVFKRDPDNRNWEPVARIFDEHGGHGFSRLGTRVRLKKTLALSTAAGTFDGSSPAMAFSVQLAPAPPHLTQQPRSQDLFPGGTIRLTAEAKGDPSPVSYQWFLDGEEIEGANDTSLVITDAAPLDSGIYSVAATDAAGTTFSYPATVRVLTDPPTIVQNPEATRIYHGAELHLEVEAEGPGPFIYQWFLDGEPIEGESANSIVVSSTDDDTAGRYSVRITNPFGSTWSEAAPVYVRESAPILLMQSGDQVVQDDQPALFFVDAIGSMDIAYQWLKDGVDLPGENAPALVFSPETLPSEDGPFQVLVTNRHGAVLSREMHLTIEESQSLPIEAGQQAIVQCLEDPTIEYDLYLPPAYNPDGPALPILFTMSPGGGGMVSSFKTIAAEKNIILVGFIQSRNGVSWPDYAGALHRVERDLRRRVNYDPSLRFASGFSGGGLASFIQAKHRHPQVAGVLSMGGWLGTEYSFKDRFKEGLIVARTAGENDSGALAFFEPDRTFLERQGAVVSDWVHSGGHIQAPDAIKRAAWDWMVEQRALQESDDRESAELAGARWRAEAAGGGKLGVLRECFTVMMERPRTWLAHQAFALFDEILMDEHLFSEEPPAIRGGDRAADFLYFYAFGAAAAGRIVPAEAAGWLLPALPDTSRDREDDFEAIAGQFNFPERPQREAYEEWSQRTGLAAEEENASPDSDFSGDGLSNFANYALGTNPLLPNRHFAAPSLTHSLQETPKLILRYRKSGTTTGLDHVIEVSDDLSLWFSMALPKSRIEGDETSGVYEVRLPAPPDGPIYLRQRFSPRN